MSTSTVDLGAGALRGSPRPSVVPRARAYFASDSQRTIQTVLGLIWLVDGGLQFQSFMYGKGFIQMLTGMTAGQPSWIVHSINWAATTLQGHQAVFNTLAGLVQVGIGVGLLSRRTVKPAIAVSFVWALIVWWFGEAFGMLFMNMANPLTGAPGAVVLYAIIGLIVWPNERPGGLLGVRGARTAWAILWVLMGWLWLIGPNSSANATRNAIDAAPSGMSWLSSVQDSAASAAQGHGLVIAVVLAFVSVAVGVAVGINWRPEPFLILAIVLSLAYWVLGQGFGGIFQGGATDPNAGPLFVLLSFTLYWLIPFEQRRPGPARSIILWPLPPEPTPGPDPKSVIGAAP
jgi:hypothetical protein